MYMSTYYMITSTSVKTFGIKWFLCQISFYSLFFLIMKSVFTIIKTENEEQSKEQKVVEQSDKSHNSIHLKQPLLNHVYTENILFICSDINILSFNSTRKNKLAFLSQSIIQHCTFLLIYFFNNKSNTYSTSLSDKESACQCRRHGLNF